MAHILTWWPSKDYEISVAHLKFTIGWETLNYRDEAGSDQVWQSSRCPLIIIQNHRIPLSGVQEKLVEKLLLSLVREKRLKERGLFEDKQGLLSCINIARY